MDDKLTKTLKKELKIHARALDIPSGAADSFINATIKSLQKTFKDKPTVSPAEFERAVKKEIKKYHPDLAYVYQNRDKII